MLAVDGSYAYVVDVGRLIDSRRRWFGLLFLLMAVGMLVWGQTWLQPHLRGLAFLGYWLVCLVWTLLALFTALTDAWATRRRLRQQQADLLREVLRSKPSSGGEDDEFAESGRRRPGRRD